MTLLRTLSALVLGSLFLVNVEASLSFDKPPANLAHLIQHRQLAHRRSAVDLPPHARVRRASNDSKRCKKRNTESSSSKSSSTTWTPEATTTSWAAKETKSSHKSNGGVSNANVVTGLIKVSSGCGGIDVGATKEISSTTGPNGQIDWLNCGIEWGGWNPPYVRVDDLVAADLQKSVDSGNSPFLACSDFIGLFNTYGWQNGLPPIMLAAFAMQESSCKPETVGGAGEQGLMQLTKDKCGNAPGGNCRDPDYNIRTAAKFIADTLARHDGNILLTIGGFNGWYKGLTVGAATAAQHNGNCRTQNNLDYLFQFVNGWLQNIDAYTTRPRLGKYHNLDACN